MCANFRFEFRHVAAHSAHQGEVATRAVDARIAELRRALRDEAGQPSYIETVVGLGYRFVGPVEGGA